MDYNEYKRQFQIFSAKAHELSETVKYEELVKEEQELSALMNKHDFWNNKENSNKIIKQVKLVKEKIAGLDEINGLLDEFEIHLELLLESDDYDISDIDTLTKNINSKLDKFENSTLLSCENDDLNAVLEIHPGAGGVESQDWALMLYNMYIKWSNKEGFKLTEINYQKGEEAGLKSVIFSVSGTNAYGLLKGEKGVHRLVRISPFDSSKKRHTSFASVDVIPEISQDIDVEINQNDLKIDTYRSGGAGGQSVNTTDSAVRITYLPLNIVVTCQNERSQLKNKEMAMKILKSKIYQHMLDERNKELSDKKASQDSIAFGSQIRSYVFHPYSMVKDLRTRVETSNAKAVIEGDLNDFIYGYLRYIV